MILYDTLIRKFPIKNISRYVEPECIESNRCERCDVEADVVSYIRHFHCGDCSHKRFFSCFRCEKKLKRTETLLFFDGNDVCDECFSAYLKKISKIYPILPKDNDEENHSKKKQKKMTNYFQPNSKT
jgi:hypothetical protein